MKTKIVNGIEVKIRTDDEILEWVGSEFRKADKTLRKTAKLVFDKRFPNPDICPTCRGKIE